MRFLCVYTHTETLVDQHGEMLCVWCERKDSDLGAIFVVQRFAAGVNLPLVWRAFDGPWQHVLIDSWVRVDMARGRKMSITHSVHSHTPEETVIRWISEHTCRGGLSLFNIKPPLLSKCVTASLILCSLQKKRNTFKGHDKKSRIKRCTCKGQNKKGLHWREAVLKLVLPVTLHDLGNFFQSTSILSV